MHQWLFPGRCWGAEQKAGPLLFWHPQSRGQHMRLAAHGELGERPEDEESLRGSTGRSPLEAPCMAYHCPLVPSL